MPKLSTAEAVLQLSPCLKFIAKRLECSAGSRLHTHRDFDPVLSTQEAAEYTGQHTKTLTSDAYAGKLPFLRRSDTDRGRLRFRLSDLNQYLDAQRVQQSPQRNATTDEIDWGAL